MLKIRTKILADQGVISVDVAEFVDNVIDYFHKEQPEISDENLVVYITHLAMASARIDKGEICDSMPKAIFSEVENSPNFEQANIINTEVLKQGNIIFPECEIEYLLLHLVNVLNK